MFGLASFDNKLPEEPVKKPNEKKANTKGKDDTNIKKTTLNNPPLFQPMMSNFNTMGGYGMNGMNGMNMMNPMMN